MISEIDPNDSWAEVELFRWQYGCLPLPTDTRQLDISAGLIGMAVAIEKKNMANFPARFNVCSVLRYAAKKLAQHTIDDDTTAYYAIEDIDKIIRQYRYKAKHKKKAPQQTKPQWVAQILCHSCGKPIKDAHWYEKDEIYWCSKCMPNNITKVSRNVRRVTTVRHRK